MKAIKKLCAALFVLPILAGLSSCSEKEAEYSAAEKLTNAQVYFSNETASQIEVKKQESSVTIPVMRINTAGALEVPITAKIENAAYAIPSKVSFADGQNTANLVITYNPDNLEYGQEDALTLQIGDASYTTAYGLSTFAGSLYVAEPWSEWELYNSAGTCTYTYSQFFSGDDEGLGFYVRRNTITPSKIQFMIENCLYGIDLILDYDAETGHVTCAPQFTGYTHSSYGQVFVTDDANYWINVRNKPDTQVDYGTFDEENGILEPCLVYYVAAGYFGDGYETITLDGYNRKDFSVVADYQGILRTPTDDLYAQADIILGADVTTANVSVIPGQLDGTILNAMLAGSYEAYVDSTEILESQIVRLSMNGAEDGEYTLVAITYDKDGEPQELDYKPFKFVTGDVETWSNKYIGTYTYSLFWTADEEGTPLDVEDLVLQQSDKDPNRYQILNWGYTGEPFVFAFQEDGSIIVEDQFIGYSHPSYGDVYVDDLVDYTGGTNYGQSYYDAESGTFYFAILYYVSAGVFANGYETFTITDVATKARLAAAQKKAMAKGNKEKKACKDSKVTKIKKAKNPKKMKQLTIKTSKAGEAVHL